MTNHIAAQQLKKPSRSRTTGHDVAAYALVSVTPKGRPHSQLAKEKEESGINQSDCSTTRNHRQPPQFRRSMRSMSPNVCPKITGDRDNGMDCRRQRPWCRMHGGSSAQCSVMAEKRSSNRNTQNPAGPNLPREPKGEKHEKNTSLSPTPSVGCRSNLCSSPIICPAGKTGSPRTSLSNPAYILAPCISMPYKETMRHWPVSIASTSQSGRRQCSSGLQETHPLAAKSPPLQDAISSPYLPLYLLIAARHRRLLTISDHIRHR